MGIGKPHIHPIKKKPTPAAWAARERMLNRKAVAAVLANPPRAVLDGFSRKLGPAWEAFQRRLAAELEEANCRDEPLILEEEDLRALAVEP